MDRAKADLVLQRLAEGLSLRKAAAEAGIDPSTVLKWEDADPEFAQQYAHARATGYKLLADELIEIADDSSGDVIETERGPVANAEFAARSRLRVDTRKWMLSKMLPKVYGDKIEHEHKGRVVITATPHDEKL
jgi:transcriptional regulator with XRE-family HTH domain